MNTWQILHGDVRERLKDLTPQSVQCVVTSPPYWGLRDYGHPGQMGTESSPNDYVDGMVGVFAEVWRVLANDGDLNPDYVQLARHRIGASAPLFSQEII